MYMKKVLILLVVILLFGCQNKDEKIKITYDDTYYQVSSPYKKAVGSYSIDTYDRNDVESMLMLLSSNYFKINNSLYQEGQYLTSDALKELISKYNDTDSINVNNVLINPSFITTIYEQNYLATNNNLKGISLAIVVNNKQYYENSGVKSYKVLEEDIALKYGMDKAGELLSYIRSKNELKNIKVVIGIYLQSNNYLKGSFKYIGQTDNNNIKFEYVNYNYQQLDSNYIMQNDINTYNSILAIKNSLSEYNTYLNATGLYKDNTLISIDININKSYLKQSEILSISNIIIDNLNSFENNVSIKIYLKSNNKTKAFLNKKSNVNNVETYILEE